MIIKCRPSDFAGWTAALRSAGFGESIRHWSEREPVEDVTYAFVWAPDPGELRQMPRLKAIFSLAAGLDHILADPDLPEVPIVRLVPPEMARGIAEYVVLACLFVLRSWPTLLRQGPDAAPWSTLRTRLARDTTVGIMGLGELGTAAAASLRAVGFPVRGWARTEKTVADVETFAGPEALPAFLSGTDILVCLLPLTPDTQDILSRRVFDRLPRGAGLVNVGRGAHLVEEDLIAALDSGQVGSAVLDVFRQEPLPADHPFWHHPRITITPHVASVPNLQERANAVVANIRALEEGRPMRLVLDRQRGY